MNPDPSGAWEPGQILEGTVARIVTYGAFVTLPDGRVGLVHISEIADAFVRDVREYLREGQRVRVKVLGTDARGRLDLSLRQALSPEERTRSQRHRTTFEEKLRAFLRESQERLTDLKRNTEAKRGGRRRR
ncbi:MAG: S1 RNA-binding domain-containing protein [Armatimonadota bacterium]|nr:S1 RNA-binding domain-containing protein [Armatimonadota bacterium]MDR7444911.1 S1 RNA-binding domain-containing protein [Armatimonadota bacterium]MDR7569130.1 S1 RNA-binding domain-containing protein [Armatimonadota bacterium]MDR7613424.1 S1 RNA-binding domain-containing protein [Armatimonadota bacterium]